MTNFCGPTRQSPDDDGFTLIELSVVVLVLAILVSVAIPTFLGGRARAQDVAARSSLRTAAAAARVAGAENSLAFVTRTALEAAEPGLTWNLEDAPSGGPTEVAWSTSPDPVPTVLVLVVRSASGKAYYQVQSELPLIGTAAAWTSFTVDGSFDASGGVEASPANALLAARGSQPDATDPSDTTVDATVPVVTTTTTMTPTTTTVPAPTTTTIPKCKGKKVYDPVSKKCK